MTRIDQTALLAVRGPANLGRYGTCFLHDEHASPATTDIFIQKDIAVPENTNKITLYGTYAWISDANISSKKGRQIYVYRTVYDYLNIYAVYSSSNFKGLALRWLVPPGLRSRNRNRSEPYSFGDFGTGTVFGIRFRFRVQGNGAKNSEKLLEL